jgi:hypothetical protein
VLIGNCRGSRTPVAFCQLLFVVEKVVLIV